MLLSFLLLILMMGVVLYMYGFNNGGFVLILGFLLMSFGMVLWFSDVMSEVILLGCYMSEVKNGLMFGVFFFIVSEVFVFLFVFWVFFYLSLFFVIEMGGFWFLLGMILLDFFVMFLLNMMLLFFFGVLIIYGYYVLMVGNSKVVMDGMLLMMMFVMLFMGL